MELKDDKLKLYMKYNIVNSSSLICRPDAKLEPYTINSHSRFPRFTQFAS